MDHGLFVSKLQDIEQRYNKLDNEILKIRKEVLRFFDLFKAWGTKMVAYNNQIVHLEKVLPKHPDIKRRLELADELARLTKEATQPCTDLVYKGKEAFDNFRAFDKELKVVYDNYKQHTADEAWMEETYKKIEEGLGRAVSNFEYFKSQKELCYSLLEQMKKKFSGEEN